MVIYYWVCFSYISEGQSLPYSASLLLALTPQQQLAMASTYCAPCI